MRNVINILSTVAHFFQRDIYLHIEIIAYLEIKVNNLVGNELSLEQFIYLIYLEI